MNLVSRVPIYVADNESTQLVGHYVPVLPSLVIIYSIQMHGPVIRSVCTPSNVMRDYVDDSIWQSHTLDHTHLRLHLYIDENEVCNPMGNRKKVHKVCAFYYSVGNVELKYRSQLRNIHLACLLNFKYV